MVMKRELLFRYNAETEKKLEALKNLPEFNGNKSQALRSAIHYYFNKRVKGEKNENK